MALEFDSSILYKLDNGYYITKVTGEECSLVFKDPENAVVAILESCGGKVTRVAQYRGRILKTLEKHILHKFIRAYKYRLNTEAAEALDLSILRIGDEPEQYLSERQLKKRLKGRLSNAHLFVSKLRMNTLRIPSFSKGGIYNLCRAQVSRLIVEKNCDLLIDMRDNPYIDALRVHESFTGSINMSRNTVESIIIDNNCRCDLAVYDSLRCFNLIIADVYSGNLNIKNSCFHAVSIGFYCYAVIKLSDNWGRRDITVGDSFRGSLSINGVNISDVNIGKDCKGKISVTSTEKHGPHQMKIDSDFAGILDVREADELEKIEIGQHARGKFNLLGCLGVKVVKFDKYFSGYADFSESAVEYVRAKYGCSGEMVFLNCENLALLKLPKDKNSAITIEREPLAVESDSNNLYYQFSDTRLPPHYFTPFYRKLYNGIKSMISGEPN
ncbi:MAG: hypothetical protein ACLTT2_02730 [Alphaproteobacteria bacterium]